MMRAGAPVVELLPPGNILVRFFVPETALGAIRMGERLAIGCDSCARELTAQVTFIAPQPEYTPPVIYSEQRATSWFTWSRRTPIRRRRRC